jgi:NADH:ubiquinone oxidoreductase subunit K
MSALIYPLAFGLIIFDLAVAAIILERHFLTRMLATELMLVASSVMLISFFSFAKVTNGDGVMMLVCIWTVAAVECMGIVAFYILMKSRGVEFEMGRQAERKPVVRK